MVQLRRRTRLDILALALDPEIRERINQISFLYKLNKFFVDSWADYQSQNNFYNRPFVIVTDQESQLETFRKNFPRGALVFVGTSAGKLPEGVFQVLKNSALATSVLDFFIFFQAKGSFLPVPKSELYPDTKIPFNASIRLPLNQRFLPVIFKGLILSDRKFQRMNERNKIYIRCQEILAYHSYVCQFNDQMGIGLRKRVRSASTAVRAQMSVLYSLLSCENKTDEAQTKFTEMLQFFSEFSGYCQGEGDILSSLYLPEVEEFDSYFAVPWITVMAGFLAVKIKLPEPERVMKASVLAHAGLLETPALAWESYQKKSIDDLSEEHMDQFKKLLERSHLKTQVLAQSIGKEDWQIADAIYERYDGLGFPQQLSDTKIPLESHLIYFCYILWQKFKELHRGGHSVEVRYLMKEVLEEEKVIANRLRPELLALLEEHFANI